MKIAEALKIGRGFKGELVVLSSQIRRTKAGRPYLTLELSDGIFTILGNHWTYESDCTPMKNSVVHVTANIEEFNGSKVLNISNFYGTGTETSTFLHCPVNKKEYLATLEVLIGQIGSKRLRVLTRTILKEHIEEYIQVPAGRKVHHNYPAGVLKHSVDVALKAKALAELTPEVSVDLCIAGGLLHDLGKVRCMYFDGLAIEHTTGGQLLDHIVIGSCILEKYKNDDTRELLTVLQHIIAAHHGKMEWGSPVLPCMTEAFLVHLADMADSKAATVQGLQDKLAGTETFTEASHFLDGRRMLSQQYVKKLLED